MTTPQERLRSIGWGADLLEILLHDATIPENLKQLAWQAATLYPRTAALLELLADPSRPFPAAAGRSIERARAVFERLQITGAGTAETRRHLQYTMRHFPLPGWSHHAEAAARLGHLNDWLEPDQPWP